MYNNIYQNKKVLVTGNTGFKGSWLTVWLLELGAKVYGISKDIPTDPSMFEALKLSDRIEHHFADINDLQAMMTLINKIKPDFLFHMAAQPIVSRSYQEPVETIHTNVVGTANVLEALRKAGHACNAVMISSDKCYRNEEWSWGYRETDHLGGKDPYSASKSACEMVISTYFHSYFKQKDSPVKLVSVRAGNVIGGGDWAESRLVPDCMRAWTENKTVVIRNPSAIRPWQHVLEPLSGYLRAGEMLATDASLNGEAFNFGPPSEEVNTVSDLLSLLATAWSESAPGKFIIDESTAFSEAGFLMLNCDKSLMRLNWKPALNFNKTISLTAEWYNRYYQQDQKMYELTVNQLNEYVSIAAKRNIHWTNQIL